MSNGAKVYIVRLADGSSTEEVRADSHHTKDGELLFLVGESEDSRIVATYARGKWVSVQEAES